MHLAKIISVANQKGGVGKTTTTVNLAACLAKQGQRVLIVDIDPQGNATSGLGVDKHQERASIYEVLVGEADSPDAVIHTQVQNLDLLPSSIALAGAEVEMVSMMAREYVLQRALSSLSDRFDFILMDCPPSLGLLTVNALAASDCVLVPIQCEFYALEGLTQLMNSVHLVRKHLNPHLELLGVVLTMFDTRTNLSSQVSEEVRRFFAEKVFETVIPRNIRLAEAPSYGQPILQYDARCPGAEAYLALSDEVLARVTGGK